MDRVARLIVFCLFLVSGGQAFAKDSVAVQSQTMYTCVSGGPQYVGSSPEAACGPYVASLNNPGSCIPAQNGNPQTCSSAQYSISSCDALPGHTCHVPYTRCSGYKLDAMSCSNGTVGVTFSDPVLTDFCGANANMVGTGASKTCACPLGYLPASNGKDCQQYTCPPSGSYSAVTQPDQLVPNAGDTICTGGCGYVPSSWKVGQDGRIWATWPYKSSGQFCSGDPSGSNPQVQSGEKNSKGEAPVACPQNQCPGVVNGASLCVPCKNSVEQGPSTSASSPEGGASAPGNTSETKTECTGVECTTTTTTKDQSGQVTGVETKTEKQESFCKENPQSSLCKQSSISGSCGGPIACDGDAIQCAIAADQIKRNCEWFDDSAAHDLATVGNAAINGNLRPDGHPANTVDQQSVSFASVIDQTDRLGGGCPVDVAVSIGGKSVNLPFSSMCGNLQLVGNLMVGFCMFAAALIVFRS